MKHLSVLFALSAVMAAAGSPADSGNLVAALYETDQSRRQGALIHALEVAAGASPELLRSLNEELKTSGCDDGAMKRLLEVWRSRPADVRCAAMVMQWADNKKVPQKTVTELLEASLRHCDLNGADAGSRNVYFELLNVCTSMLLERYDLDRAGNLLVFLNEKYPQDPRIGAAAARLYVLACFRDSDTAPGLRNWEKLPEENLWKSRLVKLQENADDMIVKDRHDAVALSQLAFALRDRKLMKKAVDIRREVPVPDDVSGAAVAGFSIAMRMPELLSWVDDELKVFVYAGAGDLNAAESAWKKSSGVARLREKLFLSGIKKDYPAVRDLILSRRVVPDSKVLFFTGCHAAVKLQDRKLLDAMLAFAENLPADLANSAGYSCVVLNHRLSDAEKLLKKALGQEPYNGAYLDSYAWLLFRKGEYVKAREIIGEALKNRIPDAAVSVMFLHAAEIELAATGDKTAARLYLERAEKLCTPDVPDWMDAEADRVRKLLK